MIQVGQTPLILRPLQLEDVDQLIIYRNDQDITSQLVGFSCGYSRADLLDWIEYHRKRDDEVLFAIADRESNRCIGHVGLYQIDQRISKANFGILIGDRSSQGKGWGTAVTAQMLDYGFLELNLHKIALKALATNARALHIYRSLGFAEEGILRDDQYRAGSYIDVVLMSMLRNEWHDQLG